MNVNDVISTCKQIISATDYSQAAEAEGAFNCEPYLITAINHVLEELYCEYCTAVRKTVVHAENGLINVGGLNLAKVIFLADKAGRAVPYRYSDNGLCVNCDGNFVLTYSKRHEPVSSPSDEIVPPSMRITERIFAYGVLKEYYTVVGDCASASVWEGKYNNAIKSACFKTFGQRLPQRRWY